MSDLESEALNKEEVLGATQEGFEAWIKLEYGIEDIDSNMQGLWPQYLEALEISEKVARQDFRSNHQ